MKNKRLPKRFLASVLLAVGILPLTLEANPPQRISSRIVDLGRVHAIYMVPRMATLIELPGPVTGITTGDPDSIRYFRPDKPENQVRVVLQNHAEPTNLILSSGKKKYVFDIIPSKTIHQDTVEVVGDFGGAALEGGDLELIDSSRPSTEKGIRK